MNERQKRVFSWVSGAHLATVILVLVLPAIKGCFRPKPKEIITFVDLSAPPPPPPEPEVEHKPKPTPEPVKISKIPPPKPVRTNSVPKKPEPKKPTPKKPEPAKPETKKPAVTNTPPKPTPKSEAERLAAVRQNRPIPPPKGPTRPTQPAARPLDFSGLRSALDSAATGSGSGGSGVYSPFAGYYEGVERQMYAVWQQPTGVPVSLTVAAVVRVERDGRVSLKSITRRSGHAALDQSVQNALNATTRLPAPPAGLPDRNITIEFELSD